MRETPPRLVPGAADDRPLSASALVPSFPLCLLSPWGRGRGGGGSIGSWPVLGGSLSTGGAGTLILGLQKNDDRCHAVPAAVRGRLARAGHLDSHKPSIGPPESMQGRQLLGTERAKTYDDIVDGARDKRGLDTVPTSAHTVIWTDRHVVVPLALGSRSITTSFPGSGQQGRSILSGANAPAKGRRRCRSPTTRVWHPFLLVFSCLVHIQLRLAGNGSEAPVNVSS